MRKLIPILFLTISFYSPIVKAQNSPQVVGFGDDLVATDALGRTMPTWDEAGNPKPNHFVGIFYWLWHDALRNTTDNDFDVTKILSVNPSKTDWRMEDFYWAEPELGYYRSNDSWVLRKHMQLFSLIGIDFIFLDFTNAIVNAPELTALLSVLQDMHHKGYPTPKVVSFLNFDPNPKIQQLYNDFYKSGRYNDCWFYWNGKPLILSPQINSMTNGSTEELNKIQNYFTWRPMWALFPKEESDAGKWRFFDEYPQRPAYKNKTLEQVVISKGFGAPLWDNAKYGSTSSTRDFTPTYNQYWTCNETGTGLFFEEQWKGAHDLQPPVLCITGWNEWKAGAWPTSQDLVNANFTFQGRKLKVGEMHFVDEFNTEFNRDLEPMKGGYTDNFFYQMAMHLRKYKGMRSSEQASPSKEIFIDGKFEEWTNVKPIFKDFEGDITPRNNLGAPLNHKYTNGTGRNDIIESRVAYTPENIYLYVKTANNITPHTDPNWMLLFIDSDKNKTTGWEGYDYIINSSVINDTLTTLKKWENNEWKQFEECKYKKVGKSMEIKIPRSSLGIASGEMEFYFHWADNIQNINSIEEFFANGDSAPERRFNYRFRTKGGVKSQSYNNETFQVPGTLEVERYNEGGQHVSYYDITSGNEGNAFRTDDVDIQSTTDVEGEFDVSNLWTGEWLTYSGEIKQDGIYTVNARVFNSNKTQHFNITFKETNKTIYYDVANGAGEWVNISKQVYLTKGASELLLFMEDVQDLRINKISFSFLGEPGKVESGDGLNAQYYNGENFETLVFERKDTLVDFDWAGESPEGGIGIDHFSVRWEGSLEVQYPGFYTFYINSDNGRKLWIDNQLIIDGWKNDWDYEYSGSIYLETGKKYALKMEYFENVGGANVELSWSSNEVTKQIIPREQLFTEKVLASDKDISNYNLSIFPNPIPLGKPINVAYNGKPVSIHLTDITGRQIFHQSHFKQNDLNTLLNGVGKGIYVIHINFQQARLSKRIIVE